MSQELQDYIAQARKAGKSDEEIAKELFSKGWKLERIQQHLKRHSKFKRKLIFFFTTLTTILIVILMFMGNSLNKLTLSIALTLFLSSLINQFKHGYYYPIPYSLTDKFPEKLNIYLWYAMLVFSIIFIPAALFVIGIYSYVILVGLGM